MHDLPRVGDRPIYLDYHATTPIDPRVARAVYECSLSVPGNASSEHAAGREANDVVSRAREEVARLVGARPSSVIFTSGATESLNLAIQGFARRYAVVYGKRPVIAVTSVEHVAVAEVCQRLRSEGSAELVEIPVDQAGQLQPDTFSEVCRKGVHLACVMGANNEIGTIYPLAELSSIARSYGAVLLTDGAQAVGKIAIAFDEWSLGFLALSAHKLYGPKGVGALVLASRQTVAALFFGGAHEGGLRPGTINVPGIVGLGEACRLRREEMLADESATARRRNRLQDLLRALVPDLVVNGDQEHRLAGNLHVAIPGAPGSAIVARLNRTVALSTGSACSSGVESPSHVIRAIGLSADLAEGCIRIGLGKFTTDGEVDFAATQIADAVREVRAAACPS